MKVYLVMHKGSPQWYKLESWVDVDNVGNNGVCVIAVRAFTKRKYAVEWIRKTENNHLIVRSATIN